MFSSGGLIFTEGSNALFCKVRLRTCLSPSVRISDTLLGDLLTAIGIASPIEMDCPTRSRISTYGHHCGVPDERQ